MEVLWCSGAVVRLFPALTPEAVAQTCETLSLGVITSQIKSETSVTLLSVSTPPRLLFFLLRLPACCRFSFLTFTSPSRRQTDKSGDMLLLLFFLFFFYAASFPLCFKFLLETKTLSFAPNSDDAITAV